jgi:hypothetical protein
MLRRNATGTALRFAMAMFFAPLAWLLPVSEAAATLYTYQVCVKYQIDTVDSSQPISGGPDNGLIEDEYQGCDSQCDVIARGARVKIDRGAWNTTKDTDPTTGCTTFTYTDPAAHVYDITIYGYATNAAGDTIRIHDDPQDIADGGDYYPGSTYSAFLNDQALTPGGGANTVYAGSYDPKWTAMGAAAYTLYRFHNTATDFQMHLGIDTTTCTGSTSAHFNGTGYGGSAHESNSKITDGKHYLQVGASASGCTPHARRKFVVAHEIGHALAALAYGSEAGASNGTEPGSTTYSNATATTPNYCYDSGTAYGIKTKEWDAVAYREAFAHFVSARVWNDKASSGSFRWIDNITYDLERYGPGYNGGSANTAGGILENVCNGSNTGAATVEDVMRFLWDFYNTDSGIYCTGGEQPSYWDMILVYAWTRLNGGLVKDNYADKTEATAETIGFANCLAEPSSADEYNYYQEHNGADY